MPVNRAFFGLNLASALTCVAILAMYLSPSVPVAFASHVIYTGFIQGIAVLFVLFVVVYTGNRAWLTSRRVALLGGEPIAFTLLLATNPFHRVVLHDVNTTQFEGLTTIQIQPTVVSDLQILYVLFLTVAGYALLVRFYSQTRSFYRKQTGLILLGGLLIPIGGFLYHGGVTPINLTPFALVVNSGIIWIALFRYDFLDVTPLAADLLIEEMDDAVLVTGPEEKIYDANGAAERLFARDQTPSAVNADSERSLTGRSLTDVSPSLAAAIDDEEPFVYTTSENDSVTLDPNVTSIEDQFGIRRGLLIVLRDVTEQVRREAELERQNERLEEFAGVVSHDLRNPLAVADGSVALARQEDDTAHLDKAADAIDRMDALVTDLLALARQGQSVDDVEQVTLASVVDDAWQNVDDHEKATLVNNAEGVLKADTQRLQQLFENLFRNAVEHGGSGVTITVGREDDELYVEDDGPGIPATERDRVFEYGHTSSSSGTGFGLAIVQTIAQAHGWSVRLTESQNGGARFVFGDLTGATPHRQQADSA
ncbi:histidine kinase N-terminal 7TM domain-containing protein [Haloarcula halophila]|nr:histidine kinase N-terminal 7TM domain-containing protein [Halomicroarcula sp. DFY41]